MDFDLVSARKSDYPSTVSVKNAIFWFKNYSLASQEETDDLTASEKKDIKKFYSSDTPKHQSSLDELLKKLNT